MQLAGAKIAKRTLSINISGIYALTFKLRGVDQGWVAIVVPPPIIAAFIPLSEVTSGNLKGWYIFIFPSFFFPFW